MDLIHQQRKESSSCIKQMVASPASKILNGSTIKQKRKQNWYSDMRVKVTLYIAGKLLDEVVEVANYEDAKKTALARNPTARVVSMTAVF